MRGRIGAATILLFLVWGCSLKTVPPVAGIPASCSAPYEVSPMRRDWDARTAELVATARRQLGTPYRYGGMDPERGFDCSGFVCYVYNQAWGKRLPRTARAQSRYVVPLARDRLHAGDLLFFDTRYGGKGPVNHCGIYLGDGTFIHASSGRVHSVTISPLDHGFYRTRFKWGGRVRRYR